LAQNLEYIKHGNTHKMNKLSSVDRAKVIQLLVEGMSMHSCARIMGISFNTVKQILITVGKACQQFHEQTVKNVPSKRVQCDEIWSFVYCKDKQVKFCEKKEGQHVGDAWVFVGMDADTKLVLSWLVGNRDAETANEFMHNVASVVSSRVQLTTDGFKPYIHAVESAFDNEIDYAMLVKIYGTPEGASPTDRKYSPPTVKGIEKRWISGDPDPKEINTSFIERQNLTMRMQMRRFTRLTNAFSKKIDHHCYMIALHFVHYNFCRIHKSLKVTPAMEAKLALKPLTIEDIITMSYAYEEERAAQKRLLARKYRR
jgi:IS1 family transposase